MDFFISFYKMYWKGADFYLTRLIRLNQTNDSFLCGVLVLSHISCKANFSWAEIVYRHFKHLAAQLLEVLSMVAKSNDLCRAHEREVLQVEKEDHVLPSQVWKIDFLEDAVDHHSDCEVKGQLSDMCVSGGHDYMGNSFTCGLPDMIGHREQRSQMTTLIKENI